MAEIFEYIKSIYCIRDQHFNRIHDSRILTVNDQSEIHTNVLSKAYDDGNETVLIFDNEVFFTRDLADVTSNEIKKFILSNNTWDILLLDPHEILETTPYNDYVKIEKVKANHFIVGKVYIASRRFLEKAKNNNLYNIETYYYNDTFIQSMTYPEQIPPYNVIVGKIKNIAYMKTGEIKYSWVNYDLI